jgi:O-acetylserine/cysteine efflux transporter
MLAVSLLVEGPARIGRSLSTLWSWQALPAVLGLLYIVVIATLVGYGLWNTLLSRHPSSVVAPFSMLVPVVGVFASWVAFRELIDPVEIVAGAAVVIGVLYASRPARPAVGREEPAGLDDLPAERAAIQ